MPKANKLSAIDGRKAGLFLFFLTIVVYLPTMNGEFIWDDELYVQKNILLHTLEGLKQIWLNTKANPQYYPLTFTTFWAEYQLWQLWPTGYHIVNVILHASNAILLWFVLRQLAVPGAWLTAAIFALHPIQVESVAQISELKNVLSSLFYFSSLLCYLHFSPSIATGETPRRVWPYYALSLAFFLCALLSKTTTCSLPVVLLILSWWKSGVIRKADLFPVIPLIILGFVFASITAVVEKEVTGAAGGDWDFSFIERILIADQALCFYLGKLLWPLNLIYIYPRWTINTTTLSLYFYPLGVLVALIGTVYFQRRIGRATLAALAFYIGTLFPVLGFVDFYLMRYTFVADHFQYLSCISIIALIVGALWQFLVRAPTSDNQMFISPMALARVFFSCILITLSFLTWKQGHIYQSAKSLWLDTLDKEPSSWVAHNNLGRVFLDRGENQQALLHLENAVRLKPDLAEAEFNLALVRMKTEDYEGAITHGLRAVRLQPGVSQFYSILGSALWNKGEISQAERYFRRAINSQSPVPQAYYNLGVLYLQEPNNFQEANQQEAISLLEKALELDPSSLQTMNALAWTLGTHPNSNIRDGRRALQLAEIACQITAYQNYTLLDTLAAAYAEVGQFPDAIRIAQIAADLSRAQSRADSTHRITERIQQYQLRHPYHRSSVEPQSVTH